MRRRKEIEGAKIKRTKEKKKRKGSRDEKSRSK